MAESPQDEHLVVDESPSPLTRDPEQNQQARLSLLLGVGGIVLLPILSIVGLVAGLLALWAGGRGLNAARRMDGKGRVLAIIGLAAGGAAVLVNAVPLVASVQRGEQMVQQSEAAQTTQVFEDADFTLSYPGHWEIQTEWLDDPVCTQMGAECLISIAVPPPLGDGININIIRIDLLQDVGVEQLELMVWQDFINSQASAALIEREAFEIDGQDAVRRDFNVESTVEGGLAYGIQVYVVREGAFLQVSAFFPGEASYTEHQDDVMAIITSLDFVE